MTATAAPTRRYVDHVMGLPVSLALSGSHSEDAAEAAWRDTMASLRAADQVFSAYRPDSWVSRLGRDEVDLADCPPEVAEVLELGERARVESGGAFDVRRRDVTGREVLDPSGVVKGWAVQRASRILDRLEGTDYCLSAGGDMVCRVAGADSPAWRIGIEDPRDPRTLVAVVPVRKGAVATSGLVHRGDHVVDARSGRVPTAVGSVTVVAADLTTADIDATAAFALGPDALTWLQNRPGRNGLVVWADGRAETFRA